MVKLNLGCGRDILEGYLNVDFEKTDPRVIVANILRLEYADHSIEEIYLRHVIEHFYEDEIYHLLINCKRMLRRGGGLIIETPDFDRIIEAWNNNYLPKTVINNILFGFNASIKSRKRESHMMHKFIFDKQLITEILSTKGFKVMDIETGVKPSDFDPIYGEYLTAMKIKAVSI